MSRLRASWLPRLLRCFTWVSNKTIVTSWLQRNSPISPACDFSAATRYSPASMVVRMHKSRLLQWLGIDKNITTKRTTTCFYGINDSLIGLSQVSTILTHWLYITKSSACPRSKMPEGEELILLLSWMTQSHCARTFLYYGIFRDHRSFGYFADASCTRDVLSPSVGSLSTSRSGNGHSVIAISQYPCLSSMGFDMSNLAPRWTIRCGTATQPIFFFSREEHFHGR